LRRLVILSRAAAKPPRPRRITLFEQKSTAGCFARLQRTQHDNKKPCQIDLAWIIHEGDGKQALVLALALRGLM
jgi:predicted NAD/FAD-binding protein